MRQHQGDGLRMLGVEQLAQLLRIGALQLGQVALRRLLRAAHQHQQIVGALLAEGLHQQPAGVVQPAVDHEVLRLEQLPELLQNLGGKLRRDAAQIGQLLGEPLHVRLRQSAQNLLGQFLAHGHQQDRGLAHSAQICRRGGVALPRFDFLLCQGSGPFVLSALIHRGPPACPAHWRLHAANRSESSSATGANSASVRASGARSPARRSPAP